MWFRDSLEPQNTPRTNQKNTLPPQTNKRLAIAKQQPEPSLVRYLGNNVCVHRPHHYYHYYHYLFSEFKLVYCFTLIYYHYHYHYHHHYHYHPHHISIDLIDGWLIDWLMIVLFCFVLYWSCVVIVVLLLPSSSFCFNEKK